MRIGRFSIHTCGQAGGAPFADRSTTFTEYSDGTLRKGNGRCIIPPWRLRWTGTRWRSEHSCQAVAVAWLGKRYQPQGEVVAVYKARG